MTTTMKKKYIKLAKKAGFAFWTNESWKPENAFIDWSSIYDDAFKRYTELLVKSVYDDAFKYYTKLLVKSVKSKKK